MLHLILVDTELETIPQQMKNEPDVKALSQRKGKAPTSILLDASYVHRSIRKFFPEDDNRRGRPDLVHTFLMLTQDSILNKKGQMKVFIHTRNNLVIKINPDARLPKSYNRFVGLIEKLFETGSINPEGTELLSVAKETLPELVRAVGCPNMRVLSPRADKVAVSQVIPNGDDLVCLIGGFSSGDYVTDVYSLAESFSIFEEELTVWTVASELITTYERCIGLLL